MERKGILAGGNFIVDVVKVIDLWPPLESLANIRHQYHSNGGGAYNILKDLTCMQVGFPLEAAGLVGDDHWGRWIREDCAAHGIDIRQLRITADADTSYTDVMTLEEGGKRTFFHYRGTNALLERTHFDLSQSQARIFHLAYMLLLDKLDEADHHGISEAARLLEEASQLGFITSADLVSVQDPGFAQVVSSALPQLDILFLNEWEAEKITGISLVQEGQIQRQAVEQACRSLIKAGIRRWVLLHFPDGAAALSAEGEMLWQGSVCLPVQHIGGTVGAGDAFAAGVLAGYHERWTMAECLKLGVSAAAACITHATCSGGMLPVHECLAWGERWGYRKY